MKRILLVDDDPLMLRMLQRTLGVYPRVWHHPLEIMAVDNYAAALLELNRCEATGLHAVVTDYDLGSGDLNGLRLLSKAPLGTLRILMSGSPPSTTGNAHYVLHKPFDTKILAKLLGLNA